MKIVISKLKLSKDQEIFAFTSSDHAVYLSLFDRITVLSRQNITNTIYNIVTHQPCSHLAIEPINSLLVASNEIEVWNFRGSIGENALFLDVIL